MTLQELYASIGGDYEAVKRVLSTDNLISRFITRLLSDTSCDRLMQAAAEHDGKNMFEAAHSMKGVCANLGLLQLSSMASAIAEEFRPGKSRTMSDEALSDILQNLREQYLSAMKMIRQYASEQG